jgi:ribosomal protein S18 acetylase RimI-like enzyme
MRETFKAPWHGEAETLRRDGVGRACEMHVAMTDGEHMLGFLAWKKSYDLHHCHTGGEILDLYVSPDDRGRGVAPVLVCAAAAEMRRRGGVYVKGQAVEHRVVQRLYARFAMDVPGADCLVRGRAFRRLAELAGRSARVVA